MNASGYMEQPYCDREEAPPVHNNINLRMFVGTWNVGGKSPHGGLSLTDWLKLPSPADIYVLGFQEIVPLNAGNVLVSEDKSPTAKWVSLISHALNGSPSPVSLLPRISFSLEDELDRDHLEILQRLNSRSLHVDGYGLQFSSGTHHYWLAVSKLMVGLFLCVWVREDLMPHVSGLRVSCAGRGIMGYLGNKGSISISVTLYRTSFFFVRTHLASGDKEGDEVRRNSDVTEIMRRTKFSAPSRLCFQPQSILDHDKIIWLGDLNYRLASSCDDTRELLRRNDWQALLQKDQLKIEQKAGRVFKGWEEGRISFAPTYKYLADSNRYAVLDATSRKKPRIPAWILWKGEGVKQMCYGRGESRFSDHSPVYSVFSVQVEFGRPITQRFSSTGSLSSAAASMAKVQAEELLLLVNRTRSCINALSPLYAMLRVLLSL